MLIYSACLSVGARIRGVTVGLISTRPVTALEKNNMSRYSCQYVRGSRLIEWAYPYVIVDNKMEDWGCILKLFAESASLCKPVRSIKWPTLLLRSQGGTSTMLNRWFVLQTRDLHLMLRLTKPNIVIDFEQTAQTCLSHERGCQKWQQTRRSFSAVEILRAWSIYS